MRINRDASVLPFYLFVLSVGEKLKRDASLKKKKSIKQDLQRHLRSGLYYPKYLHGFDQPINSQAEQTGAMQASNKHISPVLVLGKATG